MSTSPPFNLSAFPHKVLDPIATLTSPPTYASIKLAQRQLSANAAAIPSLNGGGAHGHMALTLTPAAYSDLTDIPFVIPVAPPANPVPGTTQPQIAENNRIHQRDIAVHSLYVAVNNALHQQLLDAIPRVYVREIEHEIYAYSHITCLDLLTHLWTTYGTISATDLKENIQSMYKPWNPADPIETVFHQLADAIAFSIAGDNPITETAAVRAGYDVFEHSGLFPPACENWRFAPSAKHTMANLKTRFKLADTDQKRQATTGSLGYANLLSATPSFAFLCSLRVTRLRCHPGSACQAHIFPGLASHPLLSIGQLCDTGCTATFSATRLDIHRDNILLLSGTRAPSTGLWHLNLTPPRRLATAHALIPDTSVADCIAFVHASLFSPSLSTWCTALDAGRLPTFPDITAKQVRKYPPLSAATVKGHLNQQRANLRSTKPLPPPPAPIPHPLTESPQDLCPPITTPPAGRTHHVFAAHQRVTGQIYTNQPGRFLTPSSAGHTNMLVLYDYDSNAIHVVELMKSKSGAEILAAYKRAHALFTQRGLQPQLQRLDNEASAALQSFMTANHVDFQLAPPHLHRRNAAERAICTFKNHFIAGLCSTNPDFPLHLWDRLIPQALLTLNLLHGSRINPKLSAQAQLHGAFDYNCTPLAPPGTRVLVHEKPAVRATWAPHAVDGWYLGPALHHYRCHRVWITETRAECVANTLAWFPSCIPMPTASSTDRALAAARDLLRALQNPSPASPFAPLDTTQHQALTQLADLFASITAPVSPDEAPAPAPTGQPPVPIPPPAQVRFAIPLITAEHAPPLPRVPTPTPPLPRAIQVADVAKHASLRQPQP